MSLIEVKGLKKSFGSLEVLKGVDVNVEQGERIAIIGGSGCGKSVFLRSLCLLEKPDAGQIFIDGKEITAAGAKVDEIRRSMGMVFQKFHLFSEMDVMDNLCLAPVRLKGMSRQDAEKKAMELLEQVGLSARAHAWPTVLSGGQQQRIAICRCLITDTAESGEPEAIEFEQFEGDPIKVAVTGSLPPMDYVAADGTPAGFNTAVLAEIGKRLGKNIELLQVDSVGRALALAQGNVDVVFWTRGLPENSFKNGIHLMSEEELETYRQGRAAEHSEEENAIMSALNHSYPFEQYAYRDWPEGAIITVPYYTDLNVLVTLK